MSQDCLIWSRPSTDPQIAGALQHYQYLQMQEQGVQQASYIQGINLRQIYYGISVQCCLLGRKPTWLQWGLGEGFEAVPWHRA